MIAAITCRCHNAENKLRRFLKDNNVDDWLSVPCFKGKVDGYKFIATLPPTANQPDQPQALASFLERGGSYIVIIGYDDETFMWSNVDTNDAKAKIRGELILERFA